MTIFNSMIGKSIEYAISGRLQPENGILVDAGDDILVFHRDNRYYYVPIKHVQQMRVATPHSKDSGEPSESPIDGLSGESISYRKTLYSSRGIFVEIHVTGIHSLCGYITSIMNDYIGFYSNVHHTVYVSLEHLKYIIPYPPDQLPFGTGKDPFPMKPSGLTLARSFEQQVKKMEGKLVILDLGDAVGKIGLLHSMDQGLLSLVLPDGETTVWNIHHVKSVHMP